MLRQQPPSTIRQNSAWRFSIAFVLLLVICPFSLRAQFARACRISACDNAECCGTNAILACIMSCYSGDLDCYCCETRKVYEPCVKDLRPGSPPGPPSPATPPDDDACGTPSIARGPAQARVSVSRPQPRDGASCSGSITTVDPLPDLQSGNKLIENWDMLANGGTPVGSIAADSAARVVVQIPACRAGQVFNVVLKADDQDGAEGLGTLSTVNGSENATQLNVTAVTLANGNAMAFAVYYAPPDFSRGTPDSPSNDDNVASRVVRFEATSAHPKASLCGGMTVLRPPVVLVHGLWGGSSDWDAFMPFLADPLRQFFIRRASYDYPVFVSGSTPNGYNRNQPFYANTNALGLSFNAPLVLTQIETSVMEFRQRNGAAVAQADVVAHSMGGLVTRALEQLPDFAGSNSWGKGYVHKLITIGTPHRGSPLATQLLQDNNTCVRMVLAKAQKVTFDSANLGQGWENGGVGDLQPGRAGRQR